MTYHLDSRRWKGMAVAIGFVLLAAATVVSYAVSHSVVKRRAHTQAQGQTPVCQPYKMVSRQTFTPAGGQNPILAATKVRYQKSNGDWEEVTRYFSKDGQLESKHAIFAIGGRGVFSVNDATRSLDYISTMALPAPGGSLDETANSREQALRADPHFAGEETVSERPAAILRFPQGDPASGYHVDFYYAPSLDSLAPIKQVFVNADGSTVLEPILVKLIEPTSKEFGEPPDWPVKYGLYERKLKSALDRGAPGDADAVQERIEAVRSKLGK